MDEFQLIGHYFANLTAAQEGVELGIGDDAALLAVPAGQQLVVTSDTLVAGRHFPLHTAPFDIGWKSLAVNLSDLAAMAATPRWFTLALTLPSVDKDWLAGFSEGLKALADLHGVALVGGDTTRGPLTISITAMGLVPSGSALRRDGAAEGDVVCVTGTLGDAALGLKLLMSPTPNTLPESDLASLAHRLNRPRPRVASALLLAHQATAGIDLSDGLAGDLHHILVASQVGAELFADKLPQSDAFARHAGVDALELQLHGGDDYELCFCLRPEAFADLQRQCMATGVPITGIGVITAEAGLRLREGSHVRVLAPRGYVHFEHSPAP